MSVCMMSKERGMWERVYLPELVEFDIKQGRDVIASCPCFVLRVRSRKFFLCLKVVAGFLGLDFVDAEINRQPAADYKHDG